MTYVRDRLDDLQKLHYEEERGNEKKKKKSDKDVNTYLEKCNALREEINEIRTDTRKANDILLHKQFFKLEDLQVDINPIIKKTENACGRIHKQLKEVAIDRTYLEENPSAETKMKYMQYTTLREEFQDVINLHVECAKRYEVLLEEIKKRIQQSIQGEYYEGTEENTNETQAFIGNYLLEKHAAELELRDIQERHNQLLEIEGQLTDLRQLFINIAILVEQQQESINRAEHHAEISSRNIERANDELTKADVNKKKSFKLKIILIAVTVVIALIIIILIVK